FKKEKPRLEDLKEIIKAASFAPSANNQQMWHFIIVNDQIILTKMKEAAAETIEKLENHPGIEKYKTFVKYMKNYTLFFSDAPCTIVVLKKPYFSRTENVLKTLNYSQEEIEKYRAYPDIQSIGAAIQNLLLMAHSKGYGTCWMTAPLIAKEKYEEILKIEKPYEIVALIPIGIPEESPGAPARKKIEEILTIL
ncbi:MAG: nitroreductase family protein, partial [Armatimonadetes bacterium]|nr:nitroreductase family protein [Armatimonadota bacterium]